MKIVLQNSQLFMNMPPKKVFNQSSKNVSKDEGTSKNDEKEENQDNKGLNYVLAYYFENNDIK